MLGGGVGTRHRDRDPARRVVLIAGGTCGLRLEPAGQLAGAGARWAICGRDAGGSRWLRLRRARR